MKTIFMILATIILAGCMTMGAQVGADKLVQLHTGTTTEAQAQAILGSPNQKTSNSDGTVTWSYLYAHAKVSGSTFIPLVGAFIGHTTSDYTKTDLIFDRAGVLASIAQTNGTIVAGAFHADEVAHKTQQP